jgi:DNA modification methylase
MDSTRALSIEIVPLASIVPDPANVRVHDQRNIDAIKGSLARFGQQKPIVVDAAGVIRAGNGTFLAAQGLGWQTINVVRTDLTGVEATAFAIADNRTSDLSVFDPQALSKLLVELQDEDALAGVGFDEKEINRMLDEVIAESGASLEDPGPQEPPAKPTTRTGDLWLLGEHRLLCGDSTNPDDMERLMGSEKATLLASDPPYLVDYKGGNHPQSWHNSPDVKDKHWDDYVDPTTGVEFFTTWLRTALAHCIGRVPIYQWHATRRQVLVEEAWKANGLLVHQTLIWKKARPVLTRSLYMWVHEPCFFGWREGFMPEPDRRPPPNERTVWEIDQVGQQDGIHPTQKPVAIFEKPILFHTQRGEVVLEPFSGSGTQIAAAEKTGRRCFAMEISPAYVDAAIERWQKLTGKVATLDGNPFAAVREERVA